MDGELSVNKILFLRTRANSKDVASLVASGPRGKIHFWNVFNGGRLKACFEGVSVSKGWVGFESE